MALSFDRKEGGNDGESLNWGMLWGQRGLSRANRRGTRLDPSSFPTLFYGNLYFFSSFLDPSLWGNNYHYCIILSLSSFVHMFSPPPPTRHARKEQDWHDDS